MGELTHASQAVPQSLQALVSGDVTAAGFEESGLAHSLCEHLKGQAYSFIFISKQIQETFVLLMASLSRGSAASPSLPHLLC